MKLQASIFSNSGRLLCRSLSDRPFTFLAGNRSKCKRRDIAGQLSNARGKSTFTLAETQADEIYDQAQANAASFDKKYNLKDHAKFTVPNSVRTLAIVTASLEEAMKNGSYELKSVPNHIPRPPYARTGAVPQPPHHNIINGEYSLNSLRNSARLARDVLDIACNSAKAGMTTNELDQIVHDAIISKGAYPSPLNYAGFPKSVCSSINEVICHGIPDERPMKRGDLASFDVSCFLDGFHGDNCGSIIVGDETMFDLETIDEIEFLSAKEEHLFISGQRLIQAAQEALDAAIATCKDGSCLSDIGGAISSVSDAYGYSSVEKYRGHGVGEHFHCPPFVKHFRNDDYLELKEGMVFTIEPMLTEARQDCFEWDSDGWTVATKDGGRSAQFEHMVAITKDGAEILTLPTPVDEM
uniref:Peptidase M24 domain-containing protein n=1 Tax=Chaetoceros debilis TaxID=122233 RepID=A0A7S3V6Q6_9STRA